MSFLTPTTHRRSRGRRGFSLLEVLFAIMILGMGLIAIASIFPVATVLQRETVDDLYTQQLGDSITAKIHARGFSGAQLDSVPDDGRVRAMPEGILSDPNSPEGERALRYSSSPSSDETPWLLPDRCYPSVVSDAFPEDAFEERLFYWVPLVQRNPDDTWRIFVFVLRNARTEDYRDMPGLLANPDDPVSVPAVQQYEGIVDVEFTATDEDDIIEFDSPQFPSEHLDLGTQFVDHNGNIHTVTAISGEHVSVSSNVDAVPEYIWYGVASDAGRIPTRKILTFGSEVVQ